MARRGGIEVVKLGEGVQIRGAGQGDVDRPDIAAAVDVVGVGAAVTPAAGGGGGGHAAHDGVVTAAVAAAAVPGLEGETGGDATSDEAVADREGRLQRVLLGRCLHTSHGFYWVGIGIDWL